MNNQIFNQINLKIQLAIQNYNHSGYLVDYSTKIKNEAIRFVKSIEPEVSDLINQLSSRRIACNSIEEYLDSKRNQINLDFISEQDLKEICVESVRLNIIRLISSAIMNSYLDSLYRNQNSKKNLNANLFIN